MYIRRKKIQCLREIREQCGLTGADIAEMVGVSPSYVYSFENKVANPRGMGAIKLAMVYTKMADLCGMNKTLWEEVTTDERIDPTTVSCAN